MSTLNFKIAQPKVVNHYGTQVPRINKSKQLTRLVLANMLWEDQFYVDGKSTADIIKELVATSDVKFVEQLAVAARTNYNLRHVPLLLARELARNGRLSATLLNTLIQRPDEMGEFLSIYWKDGKTALAAQIKKGLAEAFSKFNEYQLAKWNKNSAAVSLRDVLRLVHPKPTNPEQEALFGRVIRDELKTPDTWETELSAGADKGETFTRLMAENKLGALAFLRNLRNMTEAGIPTSVMREYAKTVKTDRVLPFRYIAAAKHAPALEDMLESMMLRSLESHKKLPGKTTLLIDVSGSMFGAKVSGKSELDRFDAAAALAMLCREICEEVEIYSFSDKLAAVPPRRGFALREAIKNSQPNNCTDLRQAIRSLATKGNTDRLIVFTDGETNGTDKVNFATRKYEINVAAYQNGINHSDWVTVSGFSEAVVDYIQALEAEGE